MKYKLAIFDFDGTLADSFPFFLQVVNQLARQHGFKEIDLAAAPAMRHKSPVELMKLVGMPAWKLPVVARSFIGLMKEGAACIAPFHHVDTVLHHLAGNGVKLAVVSSNSYDNIQRVLGPDTIRLFGHFECGASILGKSPRIRKVLKQAGIASADAIYIGDQVSDLEAARKEGVAFGAVAWGYGAIEFLRSHGPEAEFADVLALKAIA